MQNGHRVRWKLHTPWGMSVGHKAGLIIHTDHARGLAVICADQDKGTEYLNPYLILPLHRLELEQDLEEAA